MKNRIAKTTTITTTTNSSIVVSVMEGLLDCQDCILIRGCRRVALNNKNEPKPASCPAEKEQGVGYHIGCLLLMELCTEIISSTMD